MLEAAGIGAGMVNAAGDIATFGALGQRRRLARRHPLARVRRPARLRDRAAGGAVATSGLYERGAHVWDVAAGRPAAGVASAIGLPDQIWPSPMRFATGLVAAGSAGLDAVSAAGYEAMLVLEGGESVSTAGFPVPATV